MSGVDGLKELLNKAKTSRAIEICMRTEGQTFLSGEEKWLLEKAVVEFFKDKVVVDRKQLSEKKDKLQKRLDELSSQGHFTNESIALSSAIDVLKELLEGSNEHLNLTLAFTNVKKKKSSRSESK